MSKIYTKEESSLLEEKLSSFCKENDISFANNTNITKICNRLKINTVAMPLDKEKLDGLILVNKDFGVIATNKSLDVQESRFVIAHELAHYITKSLDKKSQYLLFAEKDRIFHGGDKKPEEHDMDYLAAAILMPKDQFTYELKAVGVDLKTISERTEKGVREKVDPFLITMFSRHYNVKEEVVVRRIAEVSYYA